MTDEELFFLEAKPLVDRQSKMRAEGQRDIPIGDSAGTCQWPGWGAESKTGTVCGLPRKEKTVKGITVPAGPYCEYHHGCAYPKA